MRPADQIEEILRSATEALDRERSRHRRASITAAQAWRESAPSDDDPDDDRGLDTDDPDADGGDAPRHRLILDSEPR